MANIISKFFWMCAGADTRLLQSEHCETDRSKYVGIGALVLCVGILAGLAAGYAFFVIFDDPGDHDDRNSLFLSVGFGVFWGLMIFSLDRFLVSTLKKSPPETKFSEKARVIAVNVLPRLILAVVLAFAISKPLEMRIFKREIEAAIPTIRNKKANEGRTEMAARNHEQSKNLEGQIAAAEAKLKPICQEAKDRRQRADDEDIKGSRWTKPGRGVTYAALDAEAKTAEDLCAKETANSPLADLQKNLKDNIANGVNLESQTNTETQDLDGMATRLEALSVVTSASAIVGATGWVIFIIILLFEISPILSKVLAPYGTYDMMLDHREKTTGSFIKEQREKNDERIERARKLKDERMFALMRLQAEALRNVDTNSSNIALSEYNSYKRELFRKSVSELKNSIDN